LKNEIAINDIDSVMVEQAGNGEMAGSRYGMASGIVVTGLEMVIMAAFRAERMEEGQ